MHDGICVILLDARGWVLSKQTCFVQADKQAAAGQDPVLDKAKNEAEKQSEAASGAVRDSGMVQTEVTDMQVSCLPDWRWCS